MNTSFVFRTFSLFKSLHCPIYWASGRSANGRITVNSKAGACSNPYKFFRFNLIRRSGFGQVIGLFRPPNKNYYAAIVYSSVSGFFLIVAPQNLEVSIKIESLSSVFNPGNSMYVHFVPIGYKLYNLSLPHSKSAVYTRSAGSGSLVVSRESNFSLLKLPSGLLKKFFRGSIGTFGVASISFNFQKFVKAGSFTAAGRKPTVRGVAKNPVDHPHGGGEGKKSKPASPRSPWGWLTVRYSSVKKKLKQ